MPGGQKASSARNFSAFEGQAIYQFIEVWHRIAQYSP